MDASRFGFIGLGMMGGPMAMRLAENGIGLAVHDPAPEATARFAAKGVPIAASVAELAAGCDVLMACLPGPEVSRAVAAELRAAAPCRVSVYAEMSTVGSACVRDVAAVLAAKPVTVLDAPVSGGPKGAAEGTLTCLVAGPADALALALPAFDALGSNLFHLGETPGLAQSMKLGNNLLAAANLAVTSEVVRMLEAAGIPPEVAVAAINVSTGRNRASEVVFPGQILSGRFSQGARLDILAKDTELAAEEAELWGRGRTVIQAVRDAWHDAKAAGHGREDITRIYDWASGHGGNRPEREGESL